MQHESAMATLEALHWLRQQEGYVKYLSIMASLDDEQREQAMRHIFPVECSQRNELIDFRDLAERFR